MNLIFLPQEGWGLICLDFDHMKRARRGVTITELIEKETAEAAQLQPQAQQTHVPGDSDGATEPTDSSNPQHGCDLSNEDAVEVAAAPSIPHGEEGSDE